MSGPTQKIRGLLSKLAPGSAIFIHGCAATPFQLIDDLLAVANDLCDITLVHLHTLGETPWADEKYSQNFRIRNYFVGHGLRKKLDYDRIDHIPCLLSEVPEIFRSKRQRIDVALLHISPPNKKGFCSLGVTVEVARAAFDAARIVIGQVNPKMPLIESPPALVRLADFDAIVEVGDDLPELPAATPTPTERKIAKHIAALVEDGSTLQVGIGGLPNAVLNELKSHRNLGLHSEMWSDGALALLNSGAINNSQKKIAPGKSVSSFLMGSKRLYDFVNKNSTVLQWEVDRVNDFESIAANPKVVAINAAVEVDLTGQICSDSVGTRIISGFGGQLDFIRAAAASKGGKPIIALSSRTAKNMPRIVTTLKLGAGVVVPRALTHFVATEFGAVNLYGKSLGERARLLISIAHPEDRENLEHQWRGLWKKIS